MNVSEWRKARQEARTLPSGLEVTLKRVSLLDLAARGNIPTTLSALADDVVSGTNKQITLSDFPKYAEIINLVVAACVVAPRIVDTLNDYKENDPALDDVLTIDELPFEDRLDIFNTVNAPAQAVKPFRAESGGDVATLRDGNGNGHAPVGVSEPA